METNVVAMEEFVTPGGPNGSENGTIDEYYNPQLDAARLLVLITFPVIFIIGTIGNVLTFIVMQRGSLKHSSYLKCAVLNNHEIVLHKFQKQKKYLEGLKLCNFLTCTTILFSCIL